MKTHAFENPKEYTIVYQRDIYSPVATVKIRPKLGSLPSSIQLHAMKEWASKWTNTPYRNVHVMS